MYYFYITKLECNGWGGWALVRKNLRSVETVQLICLSWFTRCYLPCLWTAKLNEKISSSLLLLLFRYSCPTFSPIALLCPVPLHSNSQSLPPLPMPMNLFLFLGLPLLLLSLLPPSPCPLVTVSLFLISKSLVLFFSLFVLLIRFHL